MHCTASIFLAGVLLSSGSVVSAQEQSVYRENNLINLNPDPHDEPWIAGGISFEEWNSTIPPELVIPLSKRNTSARSLPYKVDNTLHEAFRPVFNQKGGSCAQASGIGYQFTYEINVLRKLKSDVLKNQYPYDFIYNFLNGGSGERGSMSDDGWNIVKAIGIPDAQTYGGFGLGVHNHWLSGYEAYYKGMANRLSSSFSIKIKTADDITKMKQFLFDHTDGSPTGGILNYAADVTGEKIINLESGTHDAKKKAIVLFGQSGGHAMTISGYNDSICYDYNGDGKYTNNIDLDGNGTIDVRDWEVGAAIMVNTWGSSWGNSGKAYLMYRVLALDKAKGGIWSNTVNGIKIENTNNIPKLTYKIKMSFNPRSAIKIKAGYSTNPSSTSPAASILKSFAKAFYQSGGSFPMQGDNSSPIEIGLDVSDFVPKLTTNEYALFLQIESSNGSGKVERFSAIDYSTGQPVETVCQSSDVALTTGTKILKIVKTRAPLLVVSPNGGEVWERGRIFNITWTTTDSNPVSIELLKGGVLETIIVSSAPATGRYEWTIPQTIAAEGDYSIRIRNTVNSKISDISDGAFSIENMSQLELVTPNSFNYFHKNSSATISWKSNIKGLLIIDLYRHGVLEKHIDSVQASVNSYVWQVPSSITTEFDYRIRITSKDKDWLFDESDTNFGIGFPVVMLPNTQNFDNFSSGESLIDAWEQYEEDDFNWTIIKGATPSKTNPQAGGTGPNGDHTSGSGKYIYVEASSPNNPGKEATLLSPVFDLRSHSNPILSFWCHMFSKENRMGKIWIDVFANGKWNDSIGYLTGDHGDQWFQQTIELGNYINSHVQLRFRVLTGTDYDSDICIDDISMSSSVSHVVTHSNKLLLPRIILYHNHLQLKGFSGTAKIYAIDGTLLVKRMITPHDESILLNGLPSGMHLLRIGNRTYPFTRQ